MSYLSYGQCLACGGRGIGEAGVVGVGSKSVGPATPFTDSPSYKPKPGDSSPARSSSSSAPPPTGYGAPIAGATSPEEARLHQELAADLRSRSAGAQAGEAAGGAVAGAGGAIAQIISGILTPLVEGGTTAYGIYQGSRDAKSLAKQRAVELSVLQETRRRDQEFALQRAQQTAAFWQQNLGKVAIGVAGLAAVALVVPMLLGRSGGGKRKGRK